MSHINYIRDYYIYDKKINRVLAFGFKSFLSCVRYSKQYDQNEIEISYILVKESNQDAYKKRVRNHNWKFKRKLSVS